MAAAEMEIKHVAHPARPRNALEKVGCPKLPNETVFSRKAAKPAKGNQFFAPLRLCVS
jgi:hypothetical protein